MRVLILALPVGAGHVKAAQAIKQALLRLQPSVEIRYENCFAWVHPWYGPAYTHIYDFAQRHMRYLLKLLYGGVGVSSGSSSALYRLHRVLKYHFRDLIEDFRPDYVLCTHFSPGYFSALYKIPYQYRLGVVVTDYFVHPHWVNDQVDHYFIPHEDLGEQIFSYGADRSKVYPYGIPVAQELNRAVDIDAARKRFGLTKGRLSAVVMGSRVFGGEWFEVVREIVDFDYDLVVLCGANKAVMERITGLAGRARLKTYGMVERVHELLAVCDILVTKAGGITTTEASQVGPCLLFANSIVGLEDKNEDFFIQHKAALRIDPLNAKKTLAWLLVNPDKISEMRGNLKKIGKKESALNIAKIILDHGKGKV
jgi:processive 1,2-diacylglycerol beta-glucosyltransferase